VVSGLRQWSWQQPHIRDDDDEKNSAGVLHFASPLSFIQIIVGLIEIGRLHFTRLQVIWCGGKPSSSG
jgi:hypothetical protein